MTPDLSRRIEAAARAIYRAENVYDIMWEELPEIDREQWCEKAAGILEAAAPELFTDPPQAWLAPWDATIGIYGDLTRRLASSDAARLFCAQWALGSFSEDWQRMRDAYTGGSSGEPKS